MGGMQVRRRDGYPWEEVGMAMGYCSVCGGLVKILPGPTKNGKEQGWYPMTHAEKGRPESRCPGDKVPL